MSTGAPYSASLVGLYRQDDQVFWEFDPSEDYPENADGGHIIPMPGPQYVPLGGGYNFSNDAASMMDINVYAFGPVHLGQGHPYQFGWGIRFNYGFKPGLTAPFSFYTNLHVTWGVLAGLDPTITLTALPTPDPD